MSSFGGMVENIGVGQKMEEWDRKQSVCSVLSVNLAEKGEEKLSGCWGRYAVKVCSCFGEEGCFYADENAAGERGELMGHERKWTLGATPVSRPEGVDSVHQWRGVCTADSK